MSNNMTAFPWNAPRKKPGYATPALAAAWEDMWVRINDRMEKLREVAALLQEDEDKVAYALLRVFCNGDGKLLTDQNGKLLLDSLSAKKIVAAIRPTLNYVEWKHFVHFPNSIEIVNGMFILVAEWVLLRCMGLGGSEQAIPSGISKYNSSERSLYHSKTTLPVSSDNDADRAFIYTYGHIHEPQVIGRFCELTGAVQLPCPFLFQSKKYPFMTANIDAICQMPSGKLVVFEAKTTSDQNEDEWRAGPPQHYQRQPLQYMVVLDDDRIERAYIGCLMGNNNAKWYCYPIDRNPFQEQRLVENEERFFNNYIVPGIEPDLTGDNDKDLFDFFTYNRSKSTIVANTKEIELGVEYTSDFEEWERLNEKRTTLKAQLDVIEDGMAKLALDVFSGVPDDVKTAYQIIDGTSDMYSVSCGIRNLTTVDKELLRLSYPDVWAAVAKTEQSVSAPKITRKKTPKALRKA